MALAGAFIWALFFMAKPASFPTAPPLLIRVVLVTLVLTALSNMAHLTEWGFLSNTGKPSGAFLAVVGGLLRLSASCAVWVLAAVVATGYGVSTLSVGSFKDASNIKGVVALGALLLVGFILSIYFGAVSSAAGGGAGNAKFGCTVAQSGTTGGIWAGLIYLALTFSYLAFVIIRWRGTIAAEASLPRKSLLTFLGYAVISSFFILPLAEVIGACFRVVAPPPPSPPPLPSFSLTLSPLPCYSLQPLRRPTGRRCGWPRALTCSSLRRSTRCLCSCFGPRAAPTHLCPPIPRFWGRTMARWTRRTRTLRRWRAACNSLR
jgi:hypothetical protein